MRPAFAQASNDAQGHDAYPLNQDRSKILFTIGHFYVSSTDGRFSSFDGTLRFDPAAPEYGTVIIHVAPGSISTGIDARDEHLRTADFFDVARFPSATFESTSLTRNSDKKGKLTGTLSLHGVSRPISLDVTHLTPDPNADRQVFSATGTLKRSDFGMTNYLGVIGDDVTLTIEAEFDRAR
ncbi:MAG TPA: YceI family protein [Rhizomicrobium sp.]|nr:YceI family protein [Rhizomicrobium sp.]